MDFIRFLWEQPIYFLFMYLAIFTPATFIVFGIDKYKAIHGNRRISEKTLMILCTIGGSIGGLVGMYVFRHKTLHKKFTIGIPSIILLQIILVTLISILISC